MSDALWSVQDAVHDALAGSAEVQALLGNPARIFDHVPPGASFPYLTLGTTEAVANDTKDGTGMKQTITMVVWSRYRGRKEVKDILKAVYDTLHNQSLNVAGQSFASARFESAAADIDNDGVTYRGVCQYLIRTVSS